jgi:lipoprotein-anchoring transpeptidase ErfK/SrfK
MGVIRRALVLVLVLSSFVAVVPPEPAEALTSSQTGELQRWLTAKGFFRGKVDGVYGQQTSQAVMAFRKEIGVTRSFSWSDSLWPKLKTYERPYTKFSGTDRVEVNLTRQVAYVFRGGRLQAILPISSGNGEPYVNAAGTTAYATTPTGSYQLYRNYTNGWYYSYLGGLYNPWFFVGGYALHGSTSVPAEPASHGCVRLTLWDSDWINSKLYLGMPVHVWYEPRGVGPVFEGDGPFYDVSSGHRFVDAITWMVDSGVTEGCRSGFFCPDVAVTRAQLASFLARSMGLAPVEGGPFRDIRGSVHEGSINALAAIGATRGCTDTEFCPNNVITREQAAAIVARALGLEPVEEGHFVDLRGSVHTGEINAVYQAGISKGCGPEHFCPRQPMTRAEVAAFLHRAFGPAS